MGSEKPVHVWIAKRGFRNAFFFPLEHVPIPEAGTWEARKKLFKSQASKRELLWIRKLHTGRLRANGLRVACDKAAFTVE